MLLNLLNEIVNTAASGKGRSGSASQKQNRKNRQQARYRAHLLAVRCCRHGKRSAPASDSPSPSFHKLEPARRVLLRLRASAQSIVNVAERRALCARSSEHRSRTITECKRRTP